MPAAKKAPAKKAEPKEKEKPKGPQVDGFEVKDYEGLDLLVCERCGFDTFDQGSAKAHTSGHAKADKADAALAELTENLDEHAQVTTEEPADDAS